AAFSELTPSNCKVYSSARQDSKISSSSVNDALGAGVGDIFVSGFSVTATTSTGLASAAGADDTGVADTEELGIVRGTAGRSCASVMGIAVCVRGADCSTLATDD